jgi:CBS domain-containing protein
MRMSVTEIDEVQTEALTYRGLDSNVPVSKLMTPSARTIHFEIEVARLASVDALATVREAAHLMASRGLLQVQVRDAQGEIVGVLTASDLYRWVAHKAFISGLDRDELYT